MGAGKSSVGKILAEKLNLDFYDTDKLIEESTKKSISEIFESEGEDYFREREEEIVKKVTSAVKEAVVALGGGTILRLTNWEQIKHSGMIIYLKWEPNLLLNRLAHDDSRPLIANISPESYQNELLKLLEVRKPLYAKADFIIDCSEDLSETQVADEIVILFNEMNIRKVKLTDKDEWARMRNLLWPCSLKKHLEDIGKYFSKDKIDIVDVFVLQRRSGKLGGLIELNVRNYAEGSDSVKVPYVEGWYIDTDIRGNGHGKQLMKTAEMWAMEKGFDELGSDAELENSGSVAAHKALGFKEVERIVCFIKKLGSSNQLEKRE